MGKKAIRHIGMQNMFNLRDMGGYQAGNGRMVSWNKLYRGDCPAELTAAEWQQLGELGITMVVDLRSCSERKGRPVVTPPTVEYRTCPLQRDDLDMNHADKGQNAFLRSLMEGYLSMVDHEADLLVVAIKAVAEGLRKGGVLFHCSAGKDRTGVLGAALLYLCGVSREDIVADYQVSYTYNQKGINKAMSSKPGFERFLPLLNSNAENMIKLLEHFDEIKLQRVLVENGLTEGEIKGVCDLLQEDV